MDVNLIGKTVCYAPNSEFAESDNMQASRRSNFFHRTNDDKILDVQNRRKI